MKLNLETALKNLNAAYQAVVAADYTFVELIGVEYTQTEVDEYKRNLAIAERNSEEASSAFVKAHKAYLEAYNAVNFRPNFLF